MDRMTTNHRTTLSTTYHAQAATNGIATVAGHLAKLRELSDDPETVAELIGVLARLGSISGDVRRLHASMTTGRAA